MLVRTIVAVTVLLRVSCLLVKVMLKVTVIGGPMHVQSAVIVGWIACSRKRQVANLISELNIVRQVTVLIEV